MIEREGDKRDMTSKKTKTAPQTPILMSGSFEPTDFELLELTMLIPGMSSILRENILIHDT